MPQSITIGIIDDIQGMARSLVTEYAPRLRHFYYADIRLEVGEGKGAASENGMDKFSGEDYGFSFGVRVLAGDKTIAPGHFGQQVGAADLPLLAERLRQGP